MANYLYYFIKAIIFLSFFFLNTKSEIINNPMSNPYSELIYPIIFKAKGTSYNIISNRTIYSFDRITSQINFTLTLEDFAYSPPYFLCIDESNNYFLFANKEYFKIYLDSNSEILYIKKNQSITSDVSFYGYIKQKEYHGNFVDGLGVEKNEIILYGIKGEKIYFYYINKRGLYEADIKESHLGEQVSCKLILGTRYICA